jgi:hypothetical protein
VKADWITDIVIYMQDPFVLHGQKRDVSILQRDKYWGVVPENVLFIFPHYVFFNFTSGFRWGTGVILGKHFVKIEKKM